MARSGVQVTDGRVGFSSCAAGGNVLMPERIEMDAPASGLGRPAGETQPPSQGILVVMAQPPALRLSHPSRRRRVMPDAELIDVRQGCT